MPVVRTDGRAGGRSVYGQVITKFSRMGSLPHFCYPWCSAARTSRVRAPLSPFLLPSCISKEDNLASTPFTNANLTLFHSDCFTHRWWSVLWPMFHPTSIAPFSSSVRRRRRLMYRFVNTKSRVPMPRVGNSQSVLSCFSWQGWSKVCLADISPHTVAFRG